MNNLFNYNVYLYGWFLVEKNISQVEKNQLISLNSLKNHVFPLMLATNDSIMDCHVKSFHVYIYWGYDFWPQPLGVKGDEEPLS
jgi:hypothetical protein